MMRPTQKPPRQHTSDADPAIDYKILFESVPDPCLILDPVLRIAAVNDAYLRATMTKREEIIGRGIFEVFPDNPTEPEATGVRNLKASLNRVLANRVPDTMAVQKYDIPKSEEEGGFEERYWSPVNTPVFGADGTIIYIIHRVLDITEPVLLGKVGAEQSRRIGTPQYRGSLAEAQESGKGAHIFAGIGFLAAMALLVVIGWLGYRSLTEVQRSTNRVTHTYEVIIKLEELLTDLLDAETGQRGFVITGDRQYLAPYMLALGELDKDLAALKGLTVDKPGQQKRLAQLEAIVTEKLAIMGATIDTRKTKGFVAAQAMALTGQGKMYMDTIRAQIAETEQIELKLLRERLALQENRSAKLNRILLAGSLLVLALLGSIFAILMREIYRRNQAEDVLIRHQKQLYEVLDERRRGNEELARQREKLEEANNQLEVEISKRVEAQNALDAVNADLQRSNKELELFASVTSHDLQEPLLTISSYTELLAQKYQGKLDADADKYIHYIVDGTSQMHMLINDLLAYSRVGTRAKPFAPVKLDSVLDQALQNLRHSATESGLKVDRAVLPEVDGDDVQLAQLFQNLIVNAIKFRKKDMPPRVRISAQRKDDMWVIGVHDNGIGIESRFFDSIFQIFRRLHSRQEYEGSGMGLAICRKIVEHHHGQIWVESTLGEGASFYFTMPVRGGEDGG